MTQPPYSPGQYPGSVQHPSLVPPAAAAETTQPRASIGVGVTATIWASLGLIGHSIMTAYLGLGAIMTHTLDGVFNGTAGGQFNYGVLFFALLTQLLGLALSAVALWHGIRTKKMRMRRSTTALTLGIVPTAAFLLIGAIQLPLVFLLFEIL